MTKQTARRKSQGAQRSPRKGPTTAPPRRTASMVCRGFCSWAVCTVHVLRHCAACAQIICARRACLCVCAGRGGRRASCVTAARAAACGGCFVCTGLIIDAPEETDATGPLVRVLIANKIGNCRLGHNLRYPLSIEVSRATLHHTGHTFVRSMLVGFATGLRTCCVELQS